MILLAGATGFTGSLLAEALVQRGQALRVLGRSQTRLDALANRLEGEVETLVADMASPAQLLKALDGIDVVVSAAGAFLSVGDALLRASITTGTAYIDICAEQQYLKTCYEQFESLARRSNCTVVMGMGVAPALADWGASICAKNITSPQITVSHAVENYRPSRGMRQTAMKQMAHPILVWERDRWETAPLSQFQHKAVFPEPFGARDSACFPSAAVVTIPRHVEAERVSGYLAPVGDPAIGKWLSLATSAITPALPALLGSPLGAFLTAESNRDLPFPPVQPEETTFGILVEATGEDKSKTLAIMGSDPYQTTAAIAADAATSLATDAENFPSGMLAPAEAFSASPCLEKLVAKSLLRVFQG